MASKPRGRHFRASTRYATGTSQYREGRDRAWEANYRCFLPDLAGFADCPSQSRHRRAPKRCPKTIIVVAEREGFEPSVELLTLHTISSRAPSTTRSSLHGRRGHAG